MSRYLLMISLALAFLMPVASAQNSNRPRSPRRHRSIVLPPSRLVLCLDDCTRSMRQCISADPNSKYACIQEANACKASCRSQARGRSRR